MREGQQFPENRPRIAEGVRPKEDPGQEHELKGREGGQHAQQRLAAEGRPRSARARRDCKRVPRRGALPKPRTSSSGRATGRRAAWWRSDLRTYGASRDGCRRAECTSNRAARSRARCASVARSRRCRAPDTGAREVRRKAHAEQRRRTNRDVGVAREIRVNLHGVADHGHVALERRILRGRVEHAIDQVQREVVGDRRAS